MKPKFSIYVLAAIAMIALAVFVTSTHSQTTIDDYGTKKLTPERRTAAVKFHVALELMRGTFTPEQTEVLLRAVAEPKSVDESYATMFTKEQTKNIFYAIGSVDISKFKTAYKISVLADKRLYFVSLDKESRANIWRDWFAYVLATKELTRQQVDFLLEQAAYLNDPKKEQADKYAALALVLFKDQAKEIFGSIGSYTTVGKFCKTQNSDVAPLEGGDCNCSVDHSNFSCSDSCSGGGGCTTTDGGCSWLFLFNCTGRCSINADQ